MSDDAIFKDAPTDTTQDDEHLKGAVIVGSVPGQDERVYIEAARYAQLLGAPLVVAHVDVNRFISYPDPEGYMQTTAVDLQAEVGAADFATVGAEAKAAVSGFGLNWTTRELVGDPALALKHFADRVDARLIVIGTRKRGIGETMREFFSGSVAARLSHRQHRPILVVPVGKPLPDDQDWPIEE
ncbi:MAG: universal stress protein [Microbacterium sp.]